jgi:chromate transporter
VFTTATFVGYVLAGPSGAFAATAGIFAPAFFFVGMSAPFLPRLRRSAAVARMLDGLNVASLSLMAVVTLRLGVTAIVDPVTAIIALSSAVVLILSRVNSAWLVLGGGALGIMKISFG